VKLKRTTKRLLLFAPILVSILLFILTYHRWLSQGDKITLLPPSEGAFGTGQIDGLNPQTHRGVGGAIYYYGLIRREPKAVHETRYILISNCSKMC